MGMFMSEFLVVGSTFGRAPWLALILAFSASSLALGALVLRLQGMAFGAPIRFDRSRGGEPRALPIMGHFAPLLTAGVCFPPPIVDVVPARR